ncbi:MAG: hypothetical protein AMXMBFR84_21280 [Candidatus Hydrogenedentota bacterium]
MKKRIAFAFLALVAGFFLFRELKGEFIDWYADNVFVRKTAYPSSEQPDQITLTWSDDPQTTQTINWRTSPAVDTGTVEFRTVGDGDGPVQTVVATKAILEDALLENDPLNHRFTARLTGLTPDTPYEYRVGNGNTDGWSDWVEFRTAPGPDKPFSFVYMGDPQKGLGFWGGLVQKSFERCPQSAFYVIAGDLINSGNFRNEWDALFRGGTGVFDRRALVPAPGNHDYDNQNQLRLYLSVFGLPENGPEELPKEHAYSFTYGNALFVVLDSNQPPGLQTSWLEKQLAESKATWKFAVYHHPAYPSAPHRANEDVKKLWGDLFDKYHVDMALQGHDHAYLRTYPMKGGKRAASAAEGTYYMVAVSGTKFYEQIYREYSEVAFPQVSTYQVIDISTHPDKLTYRAYDIDGIVKDELIIEK